MTVRSVTLMYFLSMIHLSVFTQFGTCGSFFNSLVHSSKCLLACNFLNCASFFPHILLCWVCLCFSCVFQAMKHLVPEQRMHGLIQKSPAIPKFHNHFTSHFGCKDLFVACLKIFLFPFILFSPTPRSFPPSLPLIPM